MTEKDRKVYERQTEEAIRWAMVGEHLPREAAEAEVKPRYESIIRIAENGRKWVEKDNKRELPAWRGKNDGDTSDRSWSSFVRITKYNKIGEGIAADYGYKELIFKAYVDKESTEVWLCDLTHGNRNLTMKLLKTIKEDMIDTEDECVKIAKHYMETGKIEEEVLWQETVTD